MEQVLAALIPLAASAALVRAAIKAGPATGAASGLPLRGRWLRLAVAGVTAGCGLVILAPVTLDLGVVVIDTPRPVLYCPDICTPAPPHGLSFDAGPPYLTWSLYVGDWETDLRVLRPAPS